jgi:hypothetical protein
MFIVVCRHTFRQFIVDIIERFGKPGLDKVEG